MYGKTSQSRVSILVIRLQCKSNPTVELNFAGWEVEAINIPKEEIPADIQRLHSATYRPNQSTTALTSDVLVISGIYYAHY